MNVLALSDRFYADTNTVEKEFVKTVYAAPFQLRTDGLDVVALVVVLIPSWFSASSRAVCVYVLFFHDQGHASAALPHEERRCMTWKSRMDNEISIMPFIP